MNSSVVYVLSVFDDLEEEADKRMRVRKKGEREGDNH